MHDNDEATKITGGDEVTGGYVNVVPVDREKMRDLGVDQKASNRFASAQNTAPLNIIEFFHATPFFPIAFIRIRDDTFLPSAILGLTAGENLFVDETGNWPVSVYSPASIRRYPFITETLTSDELDSNDHDIRRPVLVDESALTKDAASLFIANGVATAEWQAIDSFISDYIAAEKLTLRFTQKLDRLKLLEAFDAQIHPDGQENIRLRGLYRINEDRLNKLPAKTIKELMHSGELSRIYAHLISLENFAKLLDRKATKTG